MASSADDKKADLRRAAIYPQSSSPSRGSNPSSSAAPPRARTAVSLTAILAPLVALLAAFPYIIRLVTPIPDAQPLTFPPLRPLPDNTIYVQPHEVQRIAEGQIAGPEDILEGADESHVYTGLSDGRVVKIDMANKVVETLFYTGMFNASSVSLFTPEFNSAYCDFSYEREAICGRPLGLTWYRKGEILLVIDPYHGMIEYNVKSKAPILHVLSKINPVDGGVGLGNALTVDQATGDIYITDTSQKHQRRDIGAAVLEGAPEGRLWRYNYHTSQAEVVLRNITFANGIIHQPGDDALYFASTTTAKIHRYYISGPNKGKHDILIDDLQCLPDNLSWDTTEPNRFWIGCSTRRSKPFSLADVGGRFPFIRQLIAAIFKPFGVNQYFKWLPKQGVFLQANTNGQVLKTIIDNTGNIVFVSHALRMGDSVYIGSVREDVQHIAKWTPTKPLKKPPPIL